VGAISDLLAPFLPLSTVDGKELDSPEAAALLVRGVLGVATTFPPGRCSDDEDEEDDADDDDRGVDRKV
jgi:hypothetical protein